MTGESTDGLMAGSMSGSGTWASRTPPEFISSRMEKIKKAKWEGEKKGPYVEMSQEEKDEKIRERDMALRAADEAQAEYWRVDAIIN